jgi:hypothetical protein
VAIAGTFSKLPEEKVDVELSFEDWCRTNWAEESTPETFDLITTAAVTVWDGATDVTATILDTSGVSADFKTVEARLKAGADDKVYSIKMVATTDAGQVFVGYLKMHVETTP